MKPKMMLRTGWLLGSLALTAACDDASPLPEPDPPLPQECLPSPTLDSQEPTTSQERTVTPQEVVHGTGGTNGLSAEKFHEYASELDHLTAVPLTQAMVPTEVEHDGEKVVKESYPVNPQIVADFLDKGDEKERAVRKFIFEHAVQCAMPTKIRILHDQLEPSKGGGVLATTDGWLHGGLSEAARDDLFTCMAVLLNPAFRGIPVFMSGPAVHDCGKSEPGYPFVEALWTMEFGGEVFGYRYHVWPRFEGIDPPECFDINNIDQVQAAFQRRVCGAADANCGLIVHVDQAWDAACKEVPLIKDGTCGETGPDDLAPDGGHFRCTAEGGAEKNAILTRLSNPCDMAYLYCSSPPPLPSDQAQ